MSDCVFLLEVIAYRVDPSCPDHGVGDTCVCFRFPGLVDLEVCEGLVCGGEADDPRTDVVTTRGKSCLFAVDASNLCRAARHLCDCAVHVYRRVKGCHAEDGPEKRLVASARLELDRTFEELILYPNGSDRTRQLTTTLPLFENGSRRPAGTVEVFVRLTSQGKLLVTRFSKTEDRENYNYKVEKQFVPADVAGPAKCTKCKRRRNLASSCCTRNRKPPCGIEYAQARKKADGCTKQMDRVECIMTAMERMKRLYVEAVSGKSQPVRPQECAFDDECPVAGCPFKIKTAEPKAQTTLDHRNFRNSGKGAEAKCTERDEAIEDDADLFVVRVGREDPCRQRDVIECRDRGTSTDFPEESPPPPPESTVKSTKRRGKSKSSKQKKGKKGVNRK